MIYSLTLRIIFPVVLIVSLIEVVPDELSKGTLILEKLSVCT